LPCVSFSIIIISPVQQVAIATAIGLSGLASDSIILELSAAGSYLVVGIFKKVNSIGVTSSVVRRYGRSDAKLFKHKLLFTKLAFSATIQC